MPNHPDSSLDVISTTFSGVMLYPAEPRKTPIHALFVLGWQLGGASYFTVKPSPLTFPRIRLVEKSPPGSAFTTWPSLSPASEGILGMKMVAQTFPFFCEGLARTGPTA